MTTHELPLYRRGTMAFMAREEKPREEKPAEMKLSPEIKALEGTGSLVDLARAYFDVTGVDYKMAADKEVWLSSIDPGVLAEPPAVEPGSIILDSGPCKVIIEELKGCDFSIRLHCPKTSTVQELTPRLVNLKDVQRGLPSLPGVPLIDLTKPFAVIELTHDEDTPEIVELYSSREDGEGGEISAQFRSRAYKWGNVGALRIDCKCTGQEPYPLVCTAHARR